MTKSTDHWTWSEMSFPKWRDAANRRLKSVYGITFSEVGIEDVQLKGYWVRKMPPNKAVESYARRVNLDPLPSVLEEGKE